MRRPQCGGWLRGSDADCGGGQRTRTAEATALRDRDPRTATANREPIRAIDPRVVGDETSLLKYQMCRMLHSFARLFTLGFAFSLPLAAQDPPKVVSLSPSHLAADVDAKTTTLTIEFDQAMGAGRSVVGGGPNFPKIKGSSWKNAKRFVIEVELEPDHTYSMGLNSNTFTNFRSTKGVVLLPVQWSFTTLPALLPDPKEQRKRNQKALDTLQQTLAEKYSYYDLRVKDWMKLFATAKPALLAAKTDAVWASAAARMLESAADIHLSLRFGEQTFATGRRAVDSLFRRERLGKYVAVKPAGNELALYGRTDDGIGYLLVAGWTQPLDLDAVDRALDELLGCKAIVVDVRPNSGGDETMAQRVAGWFVDGTKVYAKNRYRVRAGKDGFGPIFDRTVTGNTEANKRFGGPIAVLISRYVMSSNESFVMMLQQAKDCTLVGQPTFGSSGNPKPHDLGNGVTIVMPSWQDLRLDGSCLEGKGIAPNVPVDVSEQDLQSSDPILERALERLRAKLTK